MSTEEFCGAAFESFLFNNTYLGSRPTQQTKAYADYGDNNIVLFCDKCGVIWGVRMRDNATIFDFEIRQCKPHGGGSFFAIEDDIFKYPLPLPLLEHEACMALINDRPDTAY